MYRILIADDHAIVREGLKQIISDQIKDVQFGEAQNGDEVLAAVRRERWNSVILDLTMPGKGGFEVLEGIRTMRPDLPVLVVSIYPEDQFALRALRAGAVGYVAKDAPSDQLLTALRRVLAGKRYISPSLAEQIAFGGTADQLPHQRLSNRELEILLGIARGKSMTAMAEELSLSIKTVSTYRHRVLEKMGMESNAQLTRYALENHLLEG